jgi:hypothetical protein
MNAVVENDGRNKVAKQSAAMAGIATQLESAFTVTHGLISFDPAYAVGRSTQVVLARERYKKKAGAHR